MSGDLTLARQLARFVCGLSYADLGSHQVQKVKDYFLDWLGSAYAGKTLPPTRMMVDLVRSLGGTPEATVIPEGTKSSCLQAALVNGASSHVVEMDDLHRESILHPATAIIPAVLAAAERRGASGKDLMVGIVAGYEVGIRVALAAGTSHYRYWHNTATCGTFGAAAGAGKILGLSEDQMVWALGSAGTQAGGLWEFLTENAMSKQLHAAKAAMNGLLAALLAQRGFTGAARILEGDKGFFRATSQDFDEGKCVEGLGRVSMWERNSLKYHASCGHTHSTIDAVLAATGGRHCKAEDVAEVNVRVYQASLDLLENVRPTSPYLAKFSLPFCVALALGRGRVGFADFDETSLRDPEIRAMMAKVRLRSDAMLTAAFPRRWPAAVEILTRDGMRLRGSSEFPKGDPENPLSPGEVASKFRDLTGAVLAPGRADLLIERVGALDELGDMAHLLKA